MRIIFEPQYFTVLSAETKGVREIVSFRYHHPKGLFHREVDRILNFYLGKDCEKWICLEAGTTFGKERSFGIWIRSNPRVMTEGLSMKPQSPSIQSELKENKESRSLPPRRIFLPEGDK